MCELSVHRTGVAYYILGYPQGLSIYLPLSAGHMYGWKFSPSSGAKPVLKKKISLVYGFDCDGKFAPLITLF
jgi:hypothetical protein